MAAPVRLAQVGPEAPGGERRIDSEDACEDGISQRRGRTTARRKLEAEAARLENLSPLKVLSRGYSLTLKEADRAVVRSTTQVRPGDRLVTRVGDGRIVSRVEETTGSDETATL
jgi:exonuclease VII large subunit